MCMCVCVCERAKQPPGTQHGVVPFPFRSTRWKLSENANANKTMQEMHINNFPFVVYFVLFLSLHVLTRRRGGGSGRGGGGGMVTERAA